MRKVTAATLFVVAFVELAVANAQFSAAEVDSLKGLAGVGVLVESLDDEAERAGLTKADIQTDVELKLRTAGVRVLTRDERFETSGSPVLYVSVNTLQQGGGGLYAYHVNVEVRQNLESLARPGTLIVGAATWQRGRIGTIGQANLRDVRDSVGDLVDRFINDWLTANPKRQ